MHGAACGRIRDHRGSDGRANGDIECNGIEQVKELLRGPLIGGVDPASE